MRKCTKTLLGTVVITILKPLLRVLIRNEITVGDFSELMRRAYVEVVCEHFGIEGKKLSYARIAVLTGLSRKEVVRLSKLRGEAAGLVHSSPNRAQRVVNGWTNDSEFLTARGKPRVLPLRGAEQSFAALVSRYSGDITLGAILDELDRIGVVSRDAQNRVRLESNGYVPKQDELEKIHVMAVCAADLLGTAVHNIEQGDKEPLFQRQLNHPDVSAETARQFHLESANLSADYLQQLNQLLSKARAENESTAERSKTDQDNENTDDVGQVRRRVGFGIYYFEQPISTYKNEEGDPT